ncbi:hypothetical protein KCP74_20205 [Salmonella enterica subsp. enterica]|nr:hypothetical protein KCP74_20205 [Salmonella enterica subsp. enterica]
MLPPRPLTLRLFLTRSFLQCPSTRCRHDHTSRRQTRTGLRFLHSGTVRVLLAVTPLQVLADVRRVASDANIQKTLHPGR